MAPRISRAALIDIKCEHCGKTAKESVARLIGLNYLACPSCGGRINLESGDNARRLQKIAHTLAGTNGTARKPVHD